MSTVARIAFCYKGDPRTEEVAHDLDLRDSKLKPEAIIERHGQSWKVVQIEVERPITHELPLWRVHLSSWA